MIEFTQGEILKSNLTATTDPGSGDDITQGYEIGSSWVNTTTRNAFVATDVSVGAAVWRLVPFTAAGDLTGTYPNPVVSQASQAFSLNGVLSPPSFSTSQNNYNPTGLNNANVLRITTTADATITGLAGGTAGRIVTVYNVGSFKLSLSRESGSSTAANRFALDNDALLLPDTAVLLQYDSVSSRWRLAGVGSSVPTLLPAPKLFRVEVDTSATQQPPNWATLLTGNFTLASSEVNLIILYQANFAVSSNNRRIESRVLLNGAVIGGSSGNGDIANIPFHLGFLGQGVGVTGNNTIEIQWRINASTARCRPVSFPEDENASVAIWSSAAP